MPSSSALRLAAFVALGSSAPSPSVLPAPPPARCTCACRLLRLLVVPGPPPVRPDPAACPAAVLRLTCRLTRGVLHALRCLAYLIGDPRLEGLRPAAGHR